MPDASGPVHLVFELHVLFTEMTMKLSQTLSPRSFKRILRQDKEVINYP
jgi:hypothetical protein